VEKQKRCYCGELLCEENHVVHENRRICKPCWSAIVGRAVSNIPMLKALFLVLVFSLLSVSVSALTCYYENEPVLEIIDRKDVWFCTTSDVNSEYCNTYVKYGDNIIQMNPDLDVKEYGEIRYFEVNNGLVSVYFTKEKLLAGMSFNYTVDCGFEEFTAELTPVYNKNLINNQAQKTIFFKENLGYIIGVLVFIFFILILYTVAVKK